MQSDLPLQYREGMDPFQIMTDFRESIHMRVYCDLTATELEWRQIRDKDSNELVWVQKPIPVPGRKAILTEDGIKIVMDVLDTKINKISPMATFNRQECIQSAVELHWAIASAIGADLDEFLTDPDMVVQFNAVLMTIMNLIYDFNKLAENGEFRKWAKDILTIQYQHDSDMEEEPRGLVGGIKGFLSRQPPSPPNR